MVFCLMIPYALMGVVEKGEGEMEDGWMDGGGGGRREKDDEPFFGKT